MFADLGHFGAWPVRLGWLLIGYPCLLLNYLGQGAHILSPEGSIYVILLFKVQLLQTKTKQTKQMKRSWWCCVAVLQIDTAIVVVADDRLVDARHRHRITGIDFRFVSIRSIKISFVHSHVQRFFVFRCVFVDFASDLVGLVSAHSNHTYIATRRWSNLLATGKFDVVLFLFVIYFRFSVICTKKKGQLFIDGRYNCARYRIATFRSICSCVNQLEFVLHSFRLFIHL